MRRTPTGSHRWLTAVVVLHLVISFIHGAAHSGAQVFLSTAGNLFVWVVILGGPVLGLLILKWVGAIGAWLIALTMAAAGVFGIINHFVIQSADHVSHVAGPWATTFALTAGLLTLLEAGGTGLGLWSALHERRPA
jgi:hypothetical protein